MKQQDPMGRPPCCAKIGIKKGPWTPEEDVILVSYIQEHGPGNWRSVPTNTGLMRCSKSCRLRWTNYLRPGIKREDFTQEEEGMIAHLQTLLGNKWAAIASYLPQRTDNDIKNYWNTHLKKKLKKFHATTMNDPTSSTQTHRHLLTRVSHDRENTTNLTSLLRLNQFSSTTYASSTENISKLLESWMRPSGNGSAKQNHKEKNSIDESLRHSSPDSAHQGSHRSTSTEVEMKERFQCGQPGFSLLEKWIFDDDDGERAKEWMEISADCRSNSLL